MPRYEFSEGTSNKFWEITLDGSSFTTCYGKIGTPGQSTRKAFDSPEKAKKEYDKLVAEKTKKGYKLADLLQNFVKAVDSSDEPKAEKKKKAKAGKPAEAKTETPAPPPAGPPKSRLPLEREFNHDGLIGGKYKKFCARRVVTFDREKGLKEAAKGVCYWIGYAYDSEVPFDEQVDAFFADENVEKVQALIVGPWAEALSGPPKEFLKRLVKEKAKLPDLRGFFLGDIQCDENELSWISHEDFSSIFPAFPKLEHFRIRGNSPKKLGALASDSLRSFAYESADLRRIVAQGLSTARFPNLEHLELFLGPIERTGREQVRGEDLTAILSGKVFPKLRYLGLRNAEQADDLAVAVAESPILERLHTLDFSLGNLSDRGAEALLASPHLSKLARLDLRHHYVGDGLTKKLKQLVQDCDVRQRGGRDPEEMASILEDDPEATRYCSMTE